MKDEINLLLNRGVNQVNIYKNLEEKLKSGEKLRIKFGVDPTGFKLHLGHMVGLKKLADFQKLGHKIIILFGTFTGKIGDPTGRDKMRQPLTDDDINNNMKDYLSQLSKVLDVEKIEIVKNGDWLKNMNFEEILNLASVFSVQQMMHRDMFQERIKKNMDINMVEFFYPLMQGYDSVAIKADLEVGGNDQLFNFMVGRKIQEKFNMEPQNIITFKILEGTDGKEKMSKSFNNYIAIDDSPKDIFGKIMSIPDSSMENYFELLTDLDSEEVVKIIKENPRDAKVKLAQEIISFLYDDDSADKELENFNNVFQKKQIPDDIKVINIEKKEISVLDMVINSNFLKSNSEARRIIKAGGVKVNSTQEKDMDKIFSLENEVVLQVGKRNFVKFKFQ